MSKYNVVKQYSVTKACTDNVRITRYIDGEYVCDTIVDYYSLPGYQLALEDEGYELVKDLDEAKEAFDRAKEAYRHAEETYKVALRQYTCAKTNASSKNKR